MHHRESDQEDFLVLGGECLLIVEGEGGGCASGTFSTARPTRPTRSSVPAICPCVILMVGARTEQGTILYPRDEVALKRAGVEQDTPSPQEAYARFPHWRLGRPDRWDELPWNRWKRERHAADGRSSRVSRRDFCLAALTAGERARRLSR